jgi:hypothetical protein
VCSEDCRQAGEDLVLLLWDRHDGDLEGGVAGVGTPAHFNCKIGLDSNSRACREQVCYIWSWA